MTVLFADRPDGPANSLCMITRSGLNHLALMARKGHAVDHLGREVYLTHPERLAVPILFIQGLRNHIFRPAGTRKTVEWLSKHNDPALYRMLEVPEYAHLDAMTGRDAHVDVFPGVFEHFVKT